MIVEQAYGEYTDFRIPGMVATSRGTLLRYCECRKGQNDWASIDIKLSRSTDGGKCWETVTVIQSGKDTLNNPVMFVDGERLVFLYCRNYKEIWRRVSTDDGISFGDAVRVDFEREVDFFFNAVAIGPGHGIRHKGRLIVPVWFAYNREDPKDHHPSRIFTLYSEDGGESWRLGDAIFEGAMIDPSECALAVCADGEVLISIRHVSGIKRRGIAKSPDGISAWYGLRFENNLPDPVCMGSMTYRDGVIYHSNCASESKREKLTVSVSDDGFETVRSLLISEIGGYSDIALLDDKLCIFYEKSAVTELDGVRHYDPFVLHFETVELSEI